MCRDVSITTKTSEFYFNKHLFPIYDFILSWGVIHHMENTRKAFSKLVSQLKNEGMLHIMLYNKDHDWYYDGFRGDSCVEKHKEWDLLTMEQKIEKDQKEQHFISFSINRKI